MYKELKNISFRVYLGILAIFSGAILPLGFAPFGYYWVAEISLIFLLFTWFRAKPLLSFWYGWLFGVGFFGCGIYWVYISVHYYGQAPAFLAVFIVALLVAFLALYPALLGYLLNRFFPKDHWSFLLAFPSGWVILEWIRGWFLSGFPWLFLGYSHIDAPLRGWASVFGVYGVSFMIVLTAGAIFSMIYFRKSRKSLFALLLIVFVWGGGFGLTKIDWTKKVGEPIPVNLMQANIPQSDKWVPRNLWSILRSYTYLSFYSIHEDLFDSEIIVWPEAAIPTVIGDKASQSIRSYLQALANTAKGFGATVLAGAPFYDVQKGSYYNSLIAFGNSSGRYDKRQLVPFGEYMPLKSLLSWLRHFLIIPMSGFSGGDKKQPGLLVAGVLVAPFVCYEIAYPALALDYLPEAKLLVTVSDDSWFGDSIAPFQHLEIARMRSLEVGRYQLFSTNTGVSAIIDDRGKVVAKTSIFKQAVLRGNVVGVIGATPWVGWGKYLWLPLLFCGLLLGWRRCSDNAKI